MKTFFEHRDVYKCTWCRDSLVNAHPLISAQLQLTCSVQCWTFVSEEMQKCQQKYEHPHRWRLQVYFEGTQALICGASRNHTQRWRQHCCYDAWHHCIALLWGGLRSRSQSRNESEVFGWSRNRSRIPHS